jgi:Response regulator containing CheY-like receiver, AAA-type ATPase, and DNA-binding domains
MYEKYSILFVDDEVNILTSLKRALIDEEYISYFASTGNEALKIMEKQKIAVVVTDMRMPEMDGLHLLKIMKEKWPKTVGIVLSGYTALQQILITINQVDIFKFITKPWKQDELQSILYKALDYYILQEENEEYKVALQKKNEAYQNIFKSIDTIILNAKKSSEILSSCGKAMLHFNKKYKNSFPEELYSYQDQLFEYISVAVTGERKEYTTEKFAERYEQFIQEITSVTKVKNDLTGSIHIKFAPLILDAVIRSSCFVFQPEYEKNGLFVWFTMAEEAVVLSLITVRTIAEDAKMPIRLEFINSILNSTISLLNMNYSGKISKERLRVDITIPLE